MTQEKELRLEEGALLYTAEDKSITITGSRGNIARLKLPEQIEGQPVTILGKKAFLGNKNLMEITLPDTIAEIGDWAFAHCSSLKRVSLPKKELRIGKGVFKDCQAFAEAVLREGETVRESKLTHVSDAMSFSGMGQSRETVDAARCLDAEQCGLPVTGQIIPALLAATPVLLDAEYLFSPMEAGSREWLEKWDSRMLTLLRKNDESGFTRIVLCGEEDLLASLPEYVAEKQRYKARLCFLRLLHPLGMAEEVRAELQEYLQSHTKGCSSEAAWEVVLREHGDDRAYYEVLTRMGCVNEENVTDMLAGMQENHAEMKVFLMRYKEEHLKSGDFFASLSLD